MGELNAERKQLDALRRSRRQNKNIFCDCKPLNAMSTSELKVIAKQYGIEFDGNRKVKKGFLINKLRSQVLNYRDVCCWDKSCPCVEAGIDCHSGACEKNFQCGCLKYGKKCANPNGRYVYKTPRYVKGVLSEWRQYYSSDHEVEEEDESVGVRRNVSFKI